MKLALDIELFVSMSLLQMNELYHIYFCCERSEQKTQRFQQGFQKIVNGIDDFRKVDFHVNSQ